MKSTTCVRLLTVDLAMASLLEGQDAFKARALDHGLSEDELQVLVDKGVTTLSKLAFAATTPGTAPDEAQLRGLLNTDHPENVSIGSLSSIRRLMFDAQTLSVAMVRSAIEGTDMTKQAELVPAERTARVAAQKLRLSGRDLSGQFEYSYASYNYVHKMLVENQVFYLAPHHFGTRQSEIVRDKPSKELVIDASAHVTVKEAEQKDRIAIHNELQLMYAFTRRALACDVVGACTFSVLDKWHSFLLNKMETPAPPGYNKPSLEQVLRADRAAWVALAEATTTLKRQANGDLPLDAAIKQLNQDPSVLFHLLPLKGSGSSDQPAATHKKAGRARSRSHTPPRASNRSKPKGKGKGKTQQGAPVAS